MHSYMVFCAFTIIAYGKIMGYEEVNLSRDSFQTDTSLLLENLWNYRNFSDITLATNDKQELKVHKAVISSGSKLFQNLLQSKSDETRYVFVSDVEHRYLEMVIKFIYLGWCDVGQEVISEFLATGQAVGVSDLNIEHKDELTIKDEVELGGESYNQDTNL